MDADTLAFKVTKLREGNEYQFKVTAENKIGESEPVSLPEGVTAKLPFGEWRHHVVASQSCSQATRPGLCFVKKEVICVPFVQILLDHHAICGSRT